MELKYPCVDCVPTFVRLLIVLNGIEIHEAGLHQRGAGLLIVLNGIEIGLGHAKQQGYFAFNRTKWN